MLIKRIPKDLGNTLANLEKTPLVGAAILIVLTVRANIEYIMRYEQLSIARLPNASWEDPQVARQMKKVCCRSVNGSIYMQ